MRIKIFVLGGILSLYLLFGAACQSAPPVVTTEAPPLIVSSIQAPTSTPTELAPMQPLISSPTPESQATQVTIVPLPQMSLPPFNPYILGETDLEPGPEISAENAGQVTNLGGWGRGMIYELDVSHDGSRMAVKTATGMGLYDSHTMQEIAFLETVTDYRNLGVYPGTHNQLEFSPDGRILAVVVESQVHLLEAASGDASGTLEGAGENYQLMSIAFSESGELLAGSEGWSGDTNIWNVSDRKLLQSWQETPSNALTFSPDGRLLVSSSGQVHQVAGGEMLYSLDEQGYGVNQVTFSPDGQLLAGNAGMEGKLGVWRSADGEQLYSLDTYASALFSPDGQLITLVTPSGEIQVASAADGNVVSHYMVQYPEEFITQTFFSFTPDGSRFLTAGSGGQFTIWELSSGKQLYALKAHLSDVQLVQFSGDGERLLTADVEWVRAWRASDGIPLASLQLAYIAPFISPDTSTVVTEPYAYWDGMYVWNAADGSLRYLLEDARYPLTFSADSSLMAVSESSAADSGWITDTISVRRASDGTVLVHLADGDNEFDNPTYALSISADGTLLAAVLDYNDLVVWKLPEGELLYRLSGADTFPFVNVAISPDGQYLATGNDYHKVLIWRAADGMLLQTLPMESTEVMGDSGQVSSLAFSPDGKLLAATDEGGFYQLWQVGDWTSLQHNSDFVNQMYQPAVAMAFSADSTILAIGGTGNAISLWNVSDGVLLTTLTGHTDDIVRVGFSPDGKWLYSASLDGTLRFWGLSSQE